jgi:hypothetical protein
MNQPAPAARTIHFPPQLWTELSGFALMISEVLWVSLFYQALTQTLSALPVIFAVLAAVVSLSHVLARLASGKPGKTRLRQILSGVWIFLCIAVSARLLYFGQDAPGLWASFWQVTTQLFSDEQRVPAFAHMLIVSMLILRGVRLARAPITIGFNQASFRLSAAALLLYGTIYRHLLTPAAFVVLGVYLFLALAGLTISRIAHLGQTRGGKLPPFGWSWLARISLAVLGVVSTAVLTGYLLSGKIAYTVATTVVSMLGLLAVAAAYILTPIMQVVIGFIMRLLERTPGSDLMPAPASREGFQRAVEEAANNEAVLENIMQLLRTILPVVILVIVVALILSSLGWRPFSRKPQSGEDDVSEVKPGAPPGEPQAKRLLPSWLNPNRILAAARIRRIYAQLMDLCAQLENARPPAVTPLEFLPKLMILFPEEYENVRTITHAYLRVRYGEVPEDPNEVHAVTAAWKQVQQRGRQLLGQKKAAARSRPRK